MSAHRLALVLGDQLSFDLSALQALDPASDVVLLAEVMGRPPMCRITRRKLR